MSMEDLEKAFKLIPSAFEPSEVDFCGGQLPSTIKRAENILELNFPKTYYSFLEKYGCGGVGSLEIYGIIRDEEFSAESIPFVGVPNIVWTTLQWHRDYGHPLYLPIIHNVGEGTLYCLDTSQMNEEGECPVVAWPLGGYEETPVLEVIAEDFGKFFLDMVEQQIEYKKEAAQ